MKHSVCMVEMYTLSKAAWVLCLEEMHCWIEPLSASMGNFRSESHFIQV